MLKKVKTDKAPEAIGPYSQAIRVGDWLFTAGQIGIDPETQKLVEGLEGQVNQAIKNLIAVIESEGGTVQNVVKTTLFLANMADFGKVNAIYGEFFKDPYPARSTVAVKELPKGALFEIEAVVYLGK